MKKVFVFLGIMGLFLTGCSSQKNESADDTVATTSSSEIDLSDDEVYIDQLVETVDKETSETFDSQSYFTSITMDNLMRDPNSYIKQKVNLLGNVFQVSTKGKYNLYLIQSNQENNPTFAAVIETDRLETNIIEDDEVTIYGKSLHNYVYTSTSGATETVPFIYIDAYNIN